MTRTPRTFGQVTEDSLEQVGAPEPAQVEDQTQRPRPGPKAAGDHPVQLNVRLDPSTYDLLNRAYLKDYDTPGGATSLGAWVGDAIEKHAALTPARRAQSSRNLPAQESPKPRAFRIPDAVWSRLDAACAGDRKAGRRSGRSSFAQEAIGVALQKFQAQVD